LFKVIRSKRDKAIFLVVYRHGLRAPVLDPTGEGDTPCLKGSTVPTLLKDRIRLWKEGVRNVVMDTCCALHNFRVRLTPW
jgi:hypothetical protein